MPNNLISVILISLILSSGNAIAKEVLVEIKNFKFTPAQLVVAIGDTIRFANRDRAPHSVIPASNSQISFIESVVLSNNDEFILAMENQGTILARCGVHPRMPGIDVTVISKEEQLIQEIRAKLVELEELVRQ